MNDIENKDHLSVLQLINPSVGRDDPNRLQMTSSHIIQAIPILNPEVPVSPSIYNKQVVGFCDEIKTSVKEDSIIIGSFNILGEDIIITAGIESKTLEVFFTSDKIVGEYFATSNTYLVDKNSTEVIKKDEPIQILNTSDEFGNLQLGVNAKVAFMLQGKNYEDGLIISESFAKKTTHKEKSKIQFIINFNEYLLNLYGNNGEYKCLPDIGEDFNPHNRILCAKRKISKNWQTISLFNDEKNKKILFDSDEVFYAHNKTGTITNITIYPNLEPEDEKIKNSAFYNSISKYIDNSKNQIKEFVELINDYKNQGYSPSLELRYYYNKSKKMDEEKNLFFKEKHFRGFYIEIEITSIVETVLGSKLSNFHAGKGVISKIQPDELMPRNLAGEYAEIIISPNSVIGRINLGQIVETYLGKISSVIVSFIKENILDLDICINKIKEVYYYALPTRISDSLNNIIDSFSLEEQEEFICSILEDNCLIIPQVPFEDITFDNLEMLCKINDVNLEPITINGLKVKNPILFGIMYILKLKHEPSKKLTYTSFHKIGTKSLQPSKSSNDYKKFKSENIHSPNTLGEQETTLFLALPHLHILRELIFLRSSDKINRVKFLEDFFTKDELKLADYKNLSHVGVENLSFYLNAMGLNMKHN